jgi:putative aldouronate transport system substrate-binding protein
MKKGFLLFLLFCCTTILMFANGTKEASGAVKEDGPTDFLMFSWGPRDVAENDGVIIFLNQKFNINLIAERVLAKEYNNILQTRIAADDVPDVFRLRDNNIYNTLYVDDMLIDWDKKIDEFGLTNIKEYLKLGGMDDYREANGMFRLPSRKGPDKTSMFVRQDWLNQLGIDMPVNMDEYRDMLQEFKDNKPSGTETTGLTLTTGNHLEQITIGWTGMSNWGLVDGKWTYERTLPEYREALKYVNSLYEDGLLDSEAFILDESQAKGKFLSGKAGSFIIMNDRYAKFKTSLTDKGGTGEEITFVPPLAGPAGIFRPESPGLSGYVLIFQNKPEDKIKLGCEIMDYFHSTEGSSILTYGVEGVHYTVKDGKKIYNENHERDIIPGLGHLLNMMADYSSMNDLFTGVEQENYQASLKYGVFDPTRALSNEVVSEIRTNFDEFEQEWTVRFITGDLDINSDEDWNSFQSMYKKNGLDAYVEEVTKYMNRLN